MIINDKNHLKWLSVSAKYISSVSVLVDDFLRLIIYKVSVSQIVISWTVVYY